MDNDRLHCRRMPDQYVALEGLGICMRGYLYSPGCMRPSPSLGCRCCCCCRQGTTMGRQTLPALLLLALISTGEEDAPAPYGRAPRFPVISAARSHQYSTPWHTLANMHSQP